MNTTLDKLIAVATRYSELSGLSLATISTRACNDGKALPKLLIGRDVGTRIFDRTMEWFSDNWRDDWDWPDGVERPAQTKETV